MTRELYAHVILSKKEKFNRLYDKMSDYLQTNGLLNDFNLIKLTDDDHKFIRSMLNIRVKSFRNEPKLVEEFQIMENIQKMKEFFIEKMSVIPRPIVFGNRCTLDEIDFSYLDNPETDGSDKGSKFTCILSNGLEVSKIGWDTEKSNHLYGYCQTIEHLPEELQEMGSGIYMVDGLQFDYLGTYRSEITFSLNELEDFEELNHPILKMVKEFHVAENFEPENDFDDEDYDTPFGGAFASERDYQDWRFGKGFVKD